MLTLLMTGSFGHFSPSEKAYAHYTSGGGWPVSDRQATIQAVCGLPGIKGASTRSVCFINDIAGVSFIPGERRFRRSQTCAVAHSSCEGDRSTAASSWIGELK